MYGWPVRSLISELCPSPASSYTGLRILLKMLFLKTSILLSCIVSVQVSLPYKTVGFITILYSLSLVLLIILLFIVCFQQLCIHLFLCPINFSHKYNQVLEHNHFLYIQWPNLPLSWCIIAKSTELHNFCLPSKHLSFTCSANLWNTVNILSIFSTVSAITSSSAYTKMFIRPFEKFAPPGCSKLCLTAFSSTRSKSMSDNKHPCLRPLYMLKLSVSFFLAFMAFASYIAPCMHNVQIFASDFAIEWFIAVLCSLFQVFLKQWRRQKIPIDLFSVFLTVNVNLGQI